VIGQQVGKYRVADRIGRGGMGTVYRALDETLHREVAIKVLNAELNDPIVGRRFRAEAVTVARLSHPGIATIYELFEHDGQWLMAMEFVRGETLEQLILRRGPLPLEEAIDLLSRVLTPLAHAHSMGVVHRDLKPPNLMVTDTGLVKIMDFGIARVAGTEHLTHAGFMMGTPAYMAPEQVLGHETDLRADLYAMGVVFFQLLTAELPFAGTTAFAMAQSRIQDEPRRIRDVRADLPEWIDEVLQRALARKPEDRYSSADAMMDAFRRGLAGLPLEPPEPAPLSPELTATVRPNALPILDPTPEASETMLAPTPADLPTVLAPTPAAIPMAAPPRTPEATPGALPKKKKTGTGPSGIALIAAAVVVGLVAAGGLWYQSNRPSPTAGELPAPASAESTPAADVPSSSTGAGAGETSAALPVAPASGSPATPASGPPAPPTSGERPGAREAAPGPSRAGEPSGRARAAGSARPIDDSHLAFENIKLYVVSGRRGQDEDVIINLGGGRISIASAKEGTPIAAMTYSDLVRAVYVHGRDPKWDQGPGAAGPPADLDAGGVFRTSKHWLVLQAVSRYLILKLDDGNWRKVVDEVARRTGIAVEQRDGGD